MANILDVAKYFLTKVDRTEDEITHLKLQKLCYYAQAWHLAIKDAPLMDTEFQAWANGPVSPELWQEYKHYGFEPIDYPDKFNPLVLTKKERDFLDDIWEAYGCYTAKYLSDLTHQEDPWIEARGNARPGEKCTRTISKESMKQYYREMMDD